MGFIYFIQSIDGYIKIGFTKDVRKRFLQLQHANPQHLILLGVMEGEESTEKEIHQLFQHIRIRGEWFKDTPDLISFIGKNIDEDLRPNLTLMKKKRPVW